MVHRQITDLRALTMQQLENLLLQSGVPIDVIRRLARWERVKLLREIHQRQAQRLDE